MHFVYVLCHKKLSSVAFYFTKNNSGHTGLFLSFAFGPFLFPPFLRFSFQFFCTVFPQNARYST